MAEAFTELQTQDGSADLTHAEWLGLPIDREAISERQRHPAGERLFVDMRATP